MFKIFYNVYYFIFYILFISNIFLYGYILNAIDNTTKNIFFLLCVGETFVYSSRVKINVIHIYPGTFAAR